MQEPRSKQLAAAVTIEEKDAAELAVRVDKLGSVSEALRSHTVTDLVDRGRVLFEQLAQLSPADRVAS